MGTLHAVVNHNLDEHEIYTLPDLLNSTWHAVEKFLPILEDYPGPGSTPDKWQWREIEGGFTPERLHKYGTTMLEGHEFHGFVSERVFMVYHGVRWWSFLSEQTVRDKLVRLPAYCRSLRFEADHISPEWLP